jgi:hypothetical protein
MLLPGCGVHLTPLDVVEYDNEDRDDDDAFHG